MNKLFRLLLLYFVVSIIAALPTPASAQDQFIRKIFLAGKPESQGSKYRSDHSPIARKHVLFSTTYDPGTVVINTSERRLYYVTQPGRALAYGIGVGRDGFTWSGRNRISRKAEWPGWTPPAVMRSREAKKGRILPAYMPGGPDNPLGARAMYIGSTVYRIHGTNQPWTIGQAMSSGCIRMANNDVKHLYANVDIGTKVVVLR
jgi:lipoprotein-anchoring transpeptidase ErfK/SrfK